MYAIRGAVTATANNGEAILSATRDLCLQLLADNALTPDDLVSAMFTVTHDLDATFPAAATREIGWRQVPVICAAEIPVPSDLPRVIRVLVHVQGERPDAVRHVYLGEAKQLRPDWTQPQ